MKFSHSLQFNAVPEWSSKYISYTTLKKLIYTLQRESLRSRNDDDEELHLMGDQENAQSSPEDVFIAALDSELRKIDEFYRLKEKSIFKDVDDLVRDIELFEQELENTDLEVPALKRLNLATYTDSEEFRRTENDFETTLPSQTEPETDLTQDENELHSADEAQSYRGDTLPNNKLNKSKSVDDYLKSPHTLARSPKTIISQIPVQIAHLSECRILLRKRSIALFTTLSELKSFIELNETGFKKALKKFDKSLNCNIKDSYMSKLPEHYSFATTTTDELVNRIETVIKIFALICGHSDVETARNDLSVHLRDHVVWERNTVWRDLIGMERRVQAANSKVESKTNRSKDTKVSSLNVSIKNPTIIRIVSIFVVTMTLLIVSPFEDVPQKNCFALLVCASLLWATETIPLFVTSLLIPLMIVNLGVLKYPDGSQMSSSDSLKFILSTMWNSVILLLLGGFTLAASLTKYHIAKLVSTWVLSKAGTNPSIVLLTIMSIALFASMWVSNVAAPVLCFSLIQPLLRTLPRGSSFIEATILGIALASNVGGMASPIASPQNMIAIGAMNPPPSWGQWFVIALPVCVLSLMAIWFFLLLTFRCNSKNTKLVPIRIIDEQFTIVQWFIVTVTVSTILLWCFASRLEGVFGEMGIIALIPVILFFGSGLLTTADFNNYPWNIVVLAMGGTALGKAVASSGLLSTIASEIQREVEDFSLFGVTLTFGFLILIMATFVSHTVAALIIIPLVSEIGENMANPHPRLLIMASALLCSAAMGLPTSGFPNVTAICMTDEFGKPYLTVGTFLKRGVPSSIISYAIIVTVGYGTMRLINF